ncbi:MAG: glycosyltransferase family 39 protein [Candidatus Woykebacteria bacterium]
MVKNYLGKIEQFASSQRLLILIVLIVFILRIPSLLEPLWYGDEAIYLVIGQKINRGGLLYAEIFDHKTPGIYYLAAWSTKLFGDMVWSFKFLLGIWMIPTLVCFYLLVKELFDKKTAFFGLIILAALTTTPLTEGNIVNSEILIILPACLALLFGLRNHFLISGIFFSLALLLKFPAIFDFAAFFVFVFLFVRKNGALPTLVNLFKLIVGFAIPFALTLVYFASRGTLSSYINSAFFFNASYTNYGNEFIIPNGLLVLKFLPVIAIVLYYFWRFFLSKKRAASVPGAVEISVLWLAFSYYGAVFGGRPYFHYLIQAAAPFSIILAKALTDVRFRKFGFSIIGIVLILSALLGFKPNVNVLAYYPNFFNLATNRISVEEFQNNFDANTSRNYAVASLFTRCAKGDQPECKNLESANEKIYLWANQPSIYFLSGLDPASRYITAFHVSGSSTAKDRVVNDLERSKPKYIILDTLGSPPFPELDRFVKRSYNLFAISEDYAIYELSKDSTPD